MDGGVVVRPDARTVMRALRPAVWPVLLDVALDAEWRDGRLVAATSARLVAEHLRIAPGTAAAGLRVLRQHGLVELAQAAGEDGRFGLAIYTVHLPDGIEVWAPHTEIPHTDQPHTDQPDVHKPESPNTGSLDGLVLCCPWEGDLVSPQRERVESMDTGPSARQADPVTVGSPAPAAHASSSASRTDAESRNSDVRCEPGVVPGPARRRRHSSPAAQGSFDLETDQ